MAIKASMSGVDGVLKSIQQLPNNVRRRGMRIALSAAGGEYKTATAARVPRETGLLKRSLGVKVAVPTNPRKTAWVKVGARRGFRQRVERNKRGKLRAVSKQVQTLLPEHAKTIYRNPTRYLHIVEGGSKRGVRAQKFMERATVVASGRASARIAEKLRAAVLAYRN